MNWRDERTGRAGTVEARRHRVLLCDGCKRPLPLIGAKADELAGWECVHCGTAYRAAIDPRSSEQELRNVTLMHRRQGDTAVRVRKRG